MPSEIAITKDFGAENLQATFEREWLGNGENVLDSRDLFAFVARWTKRDTGRDTEEDRMPQPEADYAGTRNSFEDSTKLTGQCSCPHDNKTRFGGRTRPLSQGQREQIAFLRSVRGWTRAPKILASTQTTGESWPSETEASAWRPGTVCKRCGLNLRSPNPASSEHEGILPVLDKEHLYHWGDNLEANPGSSPRFCDSRSSLRRRACAGVVDCASILAGGVATAAILNFNRESGTCPAAGDHHWLSSIVPLLGRVEETLRCPSLPLYLAAISTYSAAGLLQLVRGHRYWADCALLAVVASVLTGAVWGGRAMVDALVLGGFLSLVCCKALELFMGRREQQLRGTLGEGDGVR